MFKLIPFDAAYNFFDEDLRKKREANIESNIFCFEDDLNH